MTHEEKCPKHPEGGLRHEYIFCHCDVASAEKKGREEGYKAYQTDHEPWKSGHIVGWNEAIDAARKVAENSFMDEVLPKHTAVRDFIADKIKALKKGGGR